MSKLIPLGVVAVCLLGVGLAFSWMKGVVRDPEGRSFANEQVPARSNAELAVPDEANAGADLASPEQEPERAANRAHADPAAAGKETIGTKAPFSIRALCLDESGDAIEGVAVTVVSLADCPIAYSDSTGHVQLEFERDLERIGVPIPALRSAGAPIAVQFSKTSRATRILYGPGLEELEHHDCGRVEMRPAGTVVGRVVGSDGLPIVGAQVLPASPIAELGEEDERNVRVSGLFWLSLEFGGAGTTTDFDGRFRLEGMSTEPSSVWSQFPGTYAAWSGPIELEAGETFDVGRLMLETLAPKDRIVGQVLNFDGSPSAHAMVTCESLTDTGIGPRTLALADKEGRFQVPALADVTHRLHVAHATNASRMVVLDEVVGGKLDVVAQFEDPKPTAPTFGVVSGRVLLGGVAAPFATLESFLYRDESGVPLSWREHRADSEGRFELELPLGVMRLQARSADGTSVGVSVEHEVVAALATEELAVESEPVATIGGFVLVSPDVESSGIESSATGPSAQELIIELESVAAIEGSVLVPPAAKANGLEFRATGPFGLRHKTVTRSDGSFEFEQLQPGSWTVKRISTPLHTRGEISPEGSEPRELTLAPGHTARLEFDLRSSAQLEGRIAIGDQSLSAWFWSIGGTQGKFTRGGRYRVAAISRLDVSRFALGARLGGSMVQVMRNLHLEPGLNQWSFEVETGSVELRDLPLDSKFPIDGQFEPVCCLHYEHDDGTVWEAMPFTAKGGKRVIENVPVGRVLVVRGGIGAVAERVYSPDAPVGEVLAELEVHAGETAIFEWRE